MLRSHDIDPVVWAQYFNVTDTRTAFGGKQLSDSQHYNWKLDDDVQTENVLQFVSLELLLQF